MQVLVVEDEALIRLLAADILEAAGCTTISAGTAAEAHRLAARLRFDAAVLDLGLPDRCGAALLGDLLGLQPALGVVISTGHRADDPQVTAARHAGGGRVAAVLGKPWKEGDLVAAVRRAAALSRIERHRGVGLHLVL